MDLEFVVIGYTTNDIVSRNCGLEITGPYSENNVLERIEEAQIDAIFIASTVPETFSYTLSIALRTGLPIIAFDIGAVGRRLEHISNKQLIPIENLADSEGLYYFLHEQQNKLNKKKVF